MLLDEKIRNIIKDIHTEAIYQGADENNTFACEMLYGMEILLTKLLDDLRYPHCKFEGYKIIKGE